MLLAPLADTGSSTVAVTQVSVLLTAIIGGLITYLTTRRNSDNDDYSRVKRQNAKYRKDILALLEYQFQVQRIMAAQGYVYPKPPHLLSEEYDEDEDDDPDLKRLIRRH